MRNRTLIPGLALLAACAHTPVGPVPPPALPQQPAFPAVMASAPLAPVPEDATLAADLAEISASEAEPYKARWEKSKDASVRPLAPGKSVSCPIEGGVLVLEAATQFAAYCGTGLIYRFGRRYEVVTVALNRGREVYPYDIRLPAAGITMPPRAFRFGQWRHPGTDQPGDKWTLVVNRP